MESYPCRSSKKERGESMMEELSFEFIKENCATIGDLKKRIAEIEESKIKRLITQKLSLLAQGKLLRNER